MPSPADPAIGARTSAPPARTHALRAFLALTFAASAVLWVALALLKGRPIAQLLLFLLMWSPGIAAIVVRRTRGQPDAGLGWRVKRPLLLVAGFAIPVAYGAGAYAVLWSTHAVGFARAALPSLAVSVAVLSVAGIPSALGEELGWRGALVPLLARRMGFTAVALASGAIWAAWHFPVFALGLADRRGVPLLPALVCFTVLAIEASFIASWLRLASDSVWPGTLFHASHNVFVLHVLASLTTDPRLALRLAGETSVLLAGACAAPAAACWALGVRLPRATTAASPPARPDAESLKVI